MISIRIISSGSTDNQVHQTVNRSQQVIRWHMPLDAELMEERFARHRPLVHHRPTFRSSQTTESEARHRREGLFNSIGRKWTSASKLTERKSGRSAPWAGECPLSPIADIQYTALGCRAQPISVS
jgi:hypothetical protein